MTAAPATPRPPSVPSAAPPARRASASALDLIDEAALRLRLAPIGTLGVYYAGSLPFVLALLYFWTDMSRSPDAALDAPGASLGMAVLFIGMKTAQAVFAARLRAQFARQPPVRWTWTRLGRLALVQSLLQPSGLFLVPLAAVLTLPLGWVYAFYGNVTALGDGETASARTVFGRAARAAMRDARGNHLALLILSLLGLFAWLNLLIATLVLPQLARMFTGEENVFTRSGLHFLFNSTFFAVTVGLVYLALDPLVKTFYALRCFYDDAQTTGEDLKSDLRALPALGSGLGVDAGVGAVAGTVRAAVLAVLLAVGCAAPFSRVVAAADAPSPPVAAPVPPPPPAAGGGVSAPVLGRSIEDVLRRREFAWRAPRPPESPDQAPAGPVERFLAGIKAWLAHAWTQASEAVGKFTAWVRHWMRGQPNEAEDAGARGGMDPATLRGLIYALIAVFAGALAVVIWRSRQGRRRDAVLRGEAAPAGPGATPDLTDETLLANQLPEDDWLRLARDLAARGERRLALRAFYLSTLAALGARGLLAIARHKSNRDYLQELGRRARDKAAVPEAFARNVGRFERVWYGPHPADDALLAEFQADRESVLAG